MPNLIVVDDTHIRKKAFASASRQLRRLERLEGRLRLFHERDRRLYQEWYDLTFRERQGQMENLRGEYMRLAEFHNWMNALVDLEDISLPEAAYRLRLEEDLYRTGTPEERRTIEERRRLRDEYIRTRTDESWRKSRRSEEAPDEFEDLADEDDDVLEDLEALAALPDEELEDWCADPETAFMVLGDCLKAANESDDFGLFFRVWDLLHVKHQKMFADAYRKAYGRSLVAVLEEMRLKMRPSDGCKAPSAEETLKLVYRQLVRKLHPDTAAGALPADDWRRPMWLRVQEAYQAKNLHQLNRLFHITLLRGNDLSSLRVGDLKTSQAWLEDEIGETEASIRGLRKQFAWGFSRRKDFAPLVKRISRQLDKEHATLAERVVDLRTHLAFLEQMGRESRRAGGGLRRRARAPSRRPAQMSFFEE